MFTKTLIAVGTAAALAVGAAPAFASTDAVFFVPRGENLGISQINDAKANVTTLLNQRGINATDVDQWGGYIRADVLLPNGEHALRFFDPATFAPVSADQLR